MVCWKGSEVLWERVSCHMRAGLSCIVVIAFPAVDGDDHSTVQYSTKYHLLSRAIPLPDLGDPK
jgi:hypothetical protein